MRHIYSIVHTDYWMSVEGVGDDYRYPKNNQWELHVVLHCSSVQLVNQLYYTEIQIKVLSHVSRVSKALQDLDANNQCVTTTTTTNR